jgi:transposase
MAKKLKTHAASFKFKVVLESFTTNNVAETARQYGIHANQLSTWRGYFLEQGPSIFQTDVTKREQELEKQIATLEQLLGKKELEIQLLKKYLDFYAPRAGSWSSTRERW